MAWLLAFLLLFALPPSATAQKKLEEQGARELVKKMRSDDRYQRGRTLAQAVAHYRIGVADFYRLHPDRIPDFDTLVTEHYILVWAADGTRPAMLSPESGDAHGFRLLQDGPLPEFAYLSYGLEHPEKESGAWTDSFKWIPTNIGKIKSLVQNQTMTELERRRGVELQMAAPVALSYIFEGVMPPNYAQACSISQLGALTTATDAPILAGFRLLVKPDSNRYAVEWTNTDKTVATTIFAFAPAQMDAAPIGTGDITGYVQLWPIPDGAPLPKLIGGGALQEQMHLTLPKNPDSAAPGITTGPPPAGLPGWGP
ncbi:MAG: hypothetical protein ABI743_00415 [bacterium]